MEPRTYFVPEKLENKRINPLKNRKRFAIIYKDKERTQVQGKTSLIRLRSNYHWSNEYSGHQVVLSEHHLSRVSKHKKRIIALYTSSRTINTIYLCDKSKCG